MKRLIVNGDDFGFTQGTNAGILRAHKEGILTSTTIMANGAAFSGAVEIALANPTLGVGCHVGLVDGQPVSKPDEIPSLVDADGRLPRSTSQLIWRLGSRIRVRDLEREIGAQIQRASAAGITLTHLDTHKHTHVYPAILKLLVGVAADFGIRRIRRPFELIAPTVAGPAARSRRSVHMKQWVVSLGVLSTVPLFDLVVNKTGILTPNRFYGIALTGIMDVAALMDLLAKTAVGTTEIMCHPGIHDGELDQARTRLKESREVELEALVDPSIRRAVGELGLELIDYRELQ